MVRSPEGPPPPPVVQRLRIRFAKRGRLRFTSHRDFQRAFERALRRAGVPIAFSAGFSPHPKVSYVGAASTGTASEAEYLEIGVARVCDPELLRQALDTSLPPGLDVLEVVEARGGSLADRVDSSLWRVELPGVDPATMRGVLAEFLSRTDIYVDRIMKDGRRRLDARAAVVSATVVGGPGAPVGYLRPGGPGGPGAGTGDDAPGAGPVEGAHCAILHLVVRHATPAVRPDDILAGLRQVADLVPPPSRTRVTRLAQGLLGEDGRIADPLAPDRGPTAPKPCDLLDGAGPANVVGASPLR